MFYAQSWALTHYLLLGSEQRKGQISRYFDLTVEGVAQDEAFSRAFAASYEQLQKELEAYLRGQSMRFFTVDMEPQKESAYNILPMARAEVLVCLGNLLEGMKGREADAETHYQQALKKKPNDARALAGLAYLAERRERPGEALALLRRAVKNSSSDFLVSYRYASSLLDSEHDQAESRQTARAALRDSIRVAPEFAPAWALLTYAFTLEPVASDEARRAGETAHEMLPSRTDVANNLLVIYARRGERRRAEQLFTRFFAVHDDPQVVAKARSVLLNIDLREAQRLMESHRDQEALTLLESLRKRVGLDHEQGAVVDESLRQLRLVIADSEFVSRYNQAVNLLNQGDLAAAKPLLENLVTSTEGSRREQSRKLLDQVLEQLEHQNVRAEVLRATALLAQGQAEEALQILKKVDLAEGSSEKQRIDEQMAEIRRILKQNLFADRFNQAIRRFNSGDFKTARRILEELLPSAAKNSREYRDIRKLLADTKAELRLRGQ